MNATRFKKPPIAKLFAAYYLVFVLVACGTDSSATSLRKLSNSPTNTPSTFQITSSPTPTPQIVPTLTSATCAPTSFHPSPDFSVHPNQPQITERSGNLCIQTFNSSRCPDTGFGQQPSNQLVLASGRTTYSQTEIAQMSSYIINANQHGWTLSNLPKGIEVPPTLQWVLGGSMDSIWASSTFGPEKEPDHCKMDLELTNLGNTPIQISKIGVELEGPPQVNTYSYRLIDLCSLIYCHFEGSGGGCAYAGNIQLGVGEKGTIFSSTPQGLVEGCNDLTISPAEQVSIYLSFTLALNTPKNMIYSLLPLITVDTTQGENVVVLQQMMITVAYATAKQFSCYTLKGSTFTLTTAGNQLEQSSQQYCM